MFQNFIVSFWFFESLFTIMEEFLSERANISKNWNDDISDEILSICNKDPFSKSQNPSGYVNLGCDVNNLCKEIAWPKLRDIWICDFDTFGYRDYETSSIKLRRAMANFMTKFFETCEPVFPENLFCSSGVTSCLDMLFHCLADPGDVFLVPTPTYSRIYKDCMQKSLVDLFPIPLLTKNDGYEDPSLTIGKIIYAYVTAVRAGHDVRGIFLINPSNPLGEIYSPKLLMDIMSFCSEHSLHLIVDEIFALSVFPTSEGFHSVLKFPHLPDTDRIHVVYGLSKDFGIPGLRIGVIHTKCKQLQKSLRNLSCFQAIPYPVMEIAADLLEDLDWCQDYVNKYQKRLAGNYEFCVNFLRKIGVKARKCDAGFFLWIDLRHVCGSSFEEEKRFFDYLLNYAKLYIRRGEEFFCVHPGWFRITFARYRNHLTAGLNRLYGALTTYRH